MYAQPGKKLLFMGGEFGQWNEWYHEVSLDWHLLESPFHSGLQRWVKDLNHVYTTEGALHELDFDPAGFQWIDCNDSDQSTISLIRRGRAANDAVLVVCNFTPVPRHNYQVGAPIAGVWREILNSDAALYGGSGQGNMGVVEAVPDEGHSRPYSLRLTLPPLSVVCFKSPGE
jgi:1,4-alpha-glucan branching enzyme